MPLKIWRKKQTIYFLRLGNLFSNHKPSFYLSTYTCTISSLIKPTLSNFQILQNQFGTRWCLVKMKGTQWLSRINKNITKHSTEFVAIAFYTNLISFVFFYINDLYHQKYTFQITCTIKLSNQKNIQIIIHMFFYKVGHFNFPLAILVSFNKLNKLSFHKLVKIPKLFQQAF